MKELVVCGGERMGAVLLAALARASRPGEVRDGYRVWVEPPREKDEAR